MKKSGFLVLMIALLCLSPTADALARSAAPQADCCFLIYSAGRSLGLAAALLHYTRERTEPGPEDSTIIRLLRSAGFYAQRVNESCPTLRPGWNNWRLMQRRLEDQIARLQSTYLHETKRRNLLALIKQAHHFWTHNLYIQYFNNKKISGPNCPNINFKLGFATAYAAQAYRQAQEALDQGRRPAAALQMQQAVTYLNIARRHLSDYLVIQRGTGLCLNLRVPGLIRRISAITVNVYPNNLAAYLIEANAISNDIGQSLRRSCAIVGSRGGGGSSPPSAGPPPAAPDSKGDYRAGMAAYKKKDYTTAMKEWGPLAEQGHALAQFGVGIMYANGWGVAKDWAKGLRWIFLAAEQGHAKAQAILGFAYFEGNGVRRDLVKAHLYLNLAAARDDRTGIKNLPIAEKRMTPAQIARAKRLAREWKPKRLKY